jgi:WD40 repeat protein
MAPAVELKPGCGTVGAGFLDDGRLVIVSTEGEVLLADPSNLGAFSRHTAIKPAPELVTVLPGDRFLCVYFKASTAAVLYSEHIEVWRLGPTQAEQLTTVSTPTGTNVGAVAHSPDGSRLAVVVRSHSVGEAGPTFREPFAIHIFDNTGRVIAELLAGVGSLGALEWSPCGRFLVGAVGLRLIVWDAENGTRLAELRAGGTGLFRGPRFHPSGRFLAAGGANIDGGVYCWDTETWSEIVAYRWPVGPVVQVIFSRDGLLAAAGGERGQVTVWDVDQ